MSLKEKRKRKEKIYRICTVVAILSVMLIVLACNAIVTEANKKAYEKRGKQKIAYFDIVYEDVLVQEENEVDGKHASDFERLYIEEYESYFRKEFEHDEDY